MKFKINRLTLLNSLNNVIKAVSLKNPLPALTGIKFEVSESDLTLTGSNSDLTIQTVIKDKDIEIYEKGKIVLNSRYIYEIIRKITGEYISFEIVDGLLTRISNENSEFNLNGSNAIDYPNIDLSKTGLKFPINSLVLKDIIDKTKFAASTKESNPVLTGINFASNEGNLEVIATDGYRLAKKILNLNNDVTFNINIPRNSLEEISKIINNDYEIYTYVSNRRILFELGDTLIQSRLIDGNYPNLNRLIPDNFQYLLEVDASYLLSVIDRVSLLEDSQSNLIKLEMNQERIILSTYTQEIGSVEEKLKDVIYKGEDLNISFSSIFANDAIKVFNDKIRIGFIGPMHPMIFKSIEDDNLIQVVLPVRTA